MSWNSLRRVDELMGAPGWLVVLLAMLALPAPGNAEQGTNACTEHATGTGPECDNENKNCGTNWHCKTINSTIRGRTASCRCKGYFPKSEAAASLTGGRWFARTNAALVQNGTSTFTLEAQPGSELWAFRLEDVAFDGTIAQQETFLNPSDLSGSIQITLGNGPPNAIPARITALHLQMVSFTCQGQPTGPNNIALDLGEPVVFGSYNALTGFIQFPNPVPCINTNSQFPAGRPMGVAPGFKLVSGNLFELYPSTEMLFPESVPSLSQLGLIIVASLLLGLGTLSIVRRRRQALTTA
jgi:hypothetical protein